MSGGQERGSVAVMVTGVTAVLAAVVLGVAVTAGEVVAAAGRAQDAADAAALAAAHAHAAGRDPLGAARDAAAASGATVARCACDRTTAVVTVRVEVTSPAARSLGVAHRTATAAARLVPP